MKFSYGKTFLLGLGFFGMSIIWPIFNQYIPIFLQAGNPEFERQLLAQGREIPNIVGFALAPSLALFIMTWDNILNMFIAPWIGAKSDNTWNRFGRRKPYILLGAPIALLAFVFVPVAQSALAIAIYIFITNFGMALFRSCANNPSAFNRCLRRSNACCNCPCPSSCICSIISWKSPRPS